MKKRKKVSPLEKELNEQREALIGICFALNEKTLPKYARDCGLSYSTVWRYWWGAYKRPDFLTIQKLAHGVGLDVWFTANGEIYTSLMK